MNVIVNELFYHHKRMNQMKIFHGILNEIYKCINNFFDLYLMMKILF